MPSIRFTYSLQLASGVQLHERTTDVQVGGDLSYDALGKAEMGFLDWFRENHSGAKLLAWVAGSSDGARCSEYRAFLPVS